MTSGGILAKFGTDLTEEKLLSLARIAETAERYEDMCEFTSELVKKKCASTTELTVEERNLLSVAFKNVVGSKRASWRTVNAEDQLAEDLLEKYKTRVEAELSGKCKEVLALLEEYLLKMYKDKKNESEVFYLKMTADYYRYMAEFSSGDSDYGAKAEENYAAAMEVAREALNETHPTRLGLALNFSVCYYEILKKPDEACTLAKEAFDGAISKLDTLNDSSYKDSTLIMQLLRDNLTLWTSEQTDDNDE